MGFKHTCKHLQEHTVCHFHFLYRDVQLCYRVHDNAHNLFFKIKKTKKNDLLNIFIECYLLSQFESHLGILFEVLFSVMDVVVTTPDIILANTPSASSLPLC